MAVANSLAHYDMATITSVKSFIVHAPGDNYDELFIISGAYFIKLFYYVLHSSPQ